MTDSPLIHCYLQGNKFRIEFIEGVFSAVVDENYNNWCRPPMDYAQMKKKLKMSFWEESYQSF